MYSLTRGIVIAVVALSALAAQAKDTDRDKLEDALKKPGATARLRRLFPLLDSKDESVKKDAEAAIKAIPAKDLIEPLTDIIRNRPYQEREAAAKFLDGIKDEQVIKSLVHTVLYDNIEQVRTAALASLKNDVEQNELIRAFWSAFFLKSNLAHIRAAEAIGMVGAGNAGAVEVLIQELFITYGSTQRVNTFFAEQTAYVKDYDIEIATNAVIADPIPATVSSGIVLDVTVLRVQERMIVITRKVIGAALKNLTGQDFGDDAKAWQNWWDKHKDDFASK